MVVLASAGSGKTASLTRRCVELLLNPTDPCSVEQLLAVTFSNEAANEMRSRIHQAIHDAARGVTDEKQRRYARQQAALVDGAKILTLHAFCHRFLRENFTLCGVDPAVRLLDEVETKFMRREALKITLGEYAAGKDAAHRAFVEFYKFTCGARPNTLFALVEPLLNNANNSLNPEEFLAAARKGTADTLIDQVRGNAVAALQEKVASYADMIRHNMDILKQYDFARVMVANLQKLIDHAAGIDSMASQQWDKFVAGLGGSAMRLDLGTVTRPRGADRATFDAVKANYYQTVSESYKKFLKEKLPEWISAATSECFKQEAEYVAAIIAFCRDAVARFQSLKARQNAMDFSDLEHKAVAALADSSNGLLAAIHSSLKHVLVDEYQDINPLQERLISLLADPGSAVDATAASRFMVGDVLQSIYGFRGAVPELLHGHHTRLRSVSSSSIPSRAVSLRENFRTIPDVLNAINAVLGPMFTAMDGITGVPKGDAGAPPQAYIKAPIRLSELPLPVPARTDLPLMGVLAGEPPTGADEPAGARPAGKYALTLTIVEKPGRPAAGLEVALEVASDARADAGSGADPGAQYGGDRDEEAPEIITLEARAVAKAIHELMASGAGVYEAGKPRPIKYSDIVILMRSVRAAAHVYVRELTQCGIPVYARLSTGLLTSQPVLETLSLLRTLENPRQDIELASTLVGMYGCMAISELALISGEQVQYRQTLYQRVAEIAECNARAGAPISEDLRGRIAAHWAKLRRWRSTIANHGMGDGLAQIFEEAGVQSYVAARRTGLQDMANLELLLQRAARFAQTDAQGVGRFLELIDYLEESDADLPAAGIYQPDSLRVMSIHASKGLEFPVVIIAGLGKLVNYQSAKCNLLSDRDGGLGLRWVDPASRMRMCTPRYMLLREQLMASILPEEARLLYVAMTRARDHLMLFGIAGADAMEKYRSNAADLPGLARQLRPRLASIAMLDLIAPIMMTLENSGQTRICRVAATAAALVVSADAGAASTPADGATSSAPADDPPVSADPYGTEMQPILDQIIFEYPHETRVPAVVSVSQLKQMEPASMDTDTEDAFNPILPPSGKQRDVQTSLRRGLAMHAFLQRTPFNALVGVQHSSDRRAALSELMADMVAREVIDSDAASLIDMAQLEWFVSKPLFHRIAAAASQCDSVYRELNIMWKMPQSQVACTLGIVPTVIADGSASEAEQDQVLVRGVIDLLFLEDDVPIIVDYKTDLAPTISARLPMYCEQIRLYADAAEKLLRRRVQERWLVFLAAHRIEAVDARSLE